MRSSCPPICAHAHGQCSSWVRAPRACAQIPDLDNLVDDVHAIDVDDVRSAHAILDRTPDLDARDALHIATMVRHGITRIASYDRGFDRVSDIERLS